MSITTALFPLICIALGIATRLAFKKANKTTDTLNNILVNYVIYLIMPAIILLRVPHFAIDDIPWYLAALAWGQVLFAAACVLAIAKLLNWSRELTGAMLMVAALGNTSFLGFPATELFFGKDALAQAIIYDQLGMFIALSLYGSIVISLYGDSTEENSSSNKKTIGNVIKKIITFPPFVALCIAIFFIQPEHIQKFSWLEKALELIAITLLPVIMFIIGLYLRFYIPKQDRLPMSIGLTIKMLLVPLTSIIIGKLVGIETLTYKVSIFEAAMPPMMTAGILAMQANLRPRLSSAMISIGLLIALVYLPALAFLINKFA